MKQINKKGLIVRLMIAALAVTILGAFIMPAWAYPPEVTNISVCVKPEKTVVAVGDVFSVNVTVANVPSEDEWAGGIRGYMVELWYNSTVLEALNFTLSKGHFLEPEPGSGRSVFIRYSRINQTQGSFYISVATNPFVVRSGNGTLLTVTFKALSTGNSAITPWNHLLPVWSVYYGYPFNGTAIVFSPDLNSDGMVDISDLTIVGKAFGSKPNNPRWNAKADMDRNGWVNILDVVLVVREMVR